MMWEILGLLMAFTFGAWMVGLVIHGVLTKRIHHTDSTSTYDLRKQPVRFLLVTMVFLAFAAMAFYLAFERWHTFFAVDDCLDDGGAWDYELERCVGAR